MIFVIKINTLKFFKLIGKKIIVTCTGRLHLFNFFQEHFEQG